MENQMSKIKMAFLLAGMLALSPGYAQTGKMNKDEAKAAHDRIEETAKAEKKACESMKGNVQDVCEAEAKAKEKVAKAELEYRQSGSEGDRVKLAEIKAEADYEVAKEKCEDLAAAQQSECKAQAKATEKAAREQVKSSSKKS